MTTRGPTLDCTLSLFARGYAWLPDRMRRSANGVVRTRLLGHEAVAVRGPDAVRFFYDEEHVRRQGALPGPVLATLFGHGAVHTLDGGAHRARKEMFLSALTSPADVARLTREVLAEWDAAVRTWDDGVVLYREVSRVLATAVCRFAGVPVEPAEVPAVADDLLAMVDGFATAGPRHWRARAARRRREEWLAGLVQEVREGREGKQPAEGTALRAVAWHRDAGGGRLEPRTAAVELLNVLRPTVAVSWFVAFAGHALHRWPRQRERLRSGGDAYATAFAHEVRRFYPFAPFLAGLAVREWEWRGEPIPEGGLVLLDVYGQNHDPELWPRPYDFDPDRFAGRPPGRDELIPQGGADPAAGHRCPGEDVVVALLGALARRLARLEYEVPEQDLSIPLRPIPTRPRSGVLVNRVRTSAS